MSKPTPASTPVCTDVTFGGSSDPSSVLVATTLEVLGVVLFLVVEAALTFGVFGAVFFLAVVLGLAVLVATTGLVSIFSEPDVGVVVHCHPPSTNAQDCPSGASS